MYVTPEKRDEMIVRNNQAYTRYYDAIQRTFTLVNQGRLGVCITVALTALVGLQRLREFQPEQLRYEGYRDLLFYTLLQRGIYLLAPQTLSDFYDGINATNSRGALFVVPNHAYALIKLYDRNLLQNQHVLSPRYTRLDTANKHGLAEKIDALKLLQVYEVADAFRNEINNPVLIFCDSKYRD